MAHDVTLVMVDNMILLLHVVTPHTCVVPIQNSLSLFGVTITSSSSWVFKITHIEEPVAPSIFHPHSSSWTAPPLHSNNKLRQCLFLGLVEIKVKAIPPSNKKASDMSGVVRLDLGFKQYISIPLVAETEGERSCCTNSYSVFHFCTFAVQVVANGSSGGNDPVKTT